MHVADHPGTQNRYPFRCLSHARRVCGLSLSKPTGAPFDKRCPELVDIRQCEPSNTPRLSNSDRCEFLRAVGDRRCAPAAGRIGRVGGARILVVEDSDAIRLPVVTALSAQGFELAARAGRNRS